MVTKRYKASTVCQIFHQYCPSHIINYHRNNSSIQNKPQQCGLVAFLLVAPSVIWQESLVINDYIGLFHALFLFTHPVVCTEKSKDTVSLLKALHAHCRRTCNFMLEPSNLYLLYPFSVSLDSTVTEKGIVI